MVAALNHAKGRSKPHQNGAHMTMPARVTTTPFVRGTRSSAPPIASTRHAPKNASSTGTVTDDAVGFERAVAVGRVPDRVPDLVVVSEVPGAWDVEGTEADTVDQGAEAGKTKRPDGRRAQVNR